MNFAWLNIKFYLFDILVLFWYTFYMIFTSTRNKKLSVSFAEAIRNCMPSDGGLYVPSQTEDLRRWILYMDENTSFSSIAGSLTSAFIREEFSPIICETIATRAFKFSPELKQLDENLFMLELFHGPTGYHKDFGIAFLVSCLETISELQGGKSVFLDVTEGPLGNILAKQIRGKKYVKSILLYPKGCIKGLEEEDFVWNGGNILPIEVDGTVEDCHELSRAIFSDRDFALENKLTVANSANIGCLLPKAFFYPYAFSRIKNKVYSDILYALEPGNYNNIVAGLYSWQFALPLNGFVLPSSDSVSIDMNGNPIFFDSLIPLKDRIPANPSEPSNLERLEEVFSANEFMMKHFIHHEKISSKDIENARKELFAKYKIYADYSTSRAFAASQKYTENSDGEENAVVLVAKDDPLFSSECKCDSSVDIVAKMNKTVDIKQKAIKSGEELKTLIESIHKYF